MIKLKEHKHHSDNSAIEALPLPEKVFIPLRQHLGKTCLPEVKAGDIVLTGQRIGSVQAHVYAPVHASVSGKIIAIEDIPHPVLGSCLGIIIESDGKDNFHPSVSKMNSDEINNLSPQQIRDIVFAAGIVGMGGAGFPTHIKLNPPQPVDTLIINGAECEPYLTADYRLMLENTHEVLKGIELIRKCLGVSNVIIAIEDNKPQAIKAFSKAIQDARYTIRVLKSMYPQGGEKQLIKNLLKREIPPQKLPFDVSVVVHNVATCFAVYEAVHFNKPLIERVLTVSGRCLTKAANIRARLGTPLKQLIDFCGPLVEDPAKIVCGGPMMGIAQYTTDVPVVKTTSGFLFFNDRQAKPYKEEPCIRCGACIRECPVGLMPCLINLASEAGLWDKAGDYYASDCIECGVCSYVCPANRRLVQSIKRAKLEIAK